MYKCMIIKRKLNITTPAVTLLIINKIVIQIAIYQSYLSSMKYINLKL